MEVVAIKPRSYSCLALRQQDRGMVVVGDRNEREGEGERMCVCVCATGGYQKEKKHNANSRSCGVPTLEVAWGSASIHCPESHDLWISVTQKKGSMTTCVECYHESFQ